MISMDLSKYLPDEAGSPADAGRQLSKEEYAALKKQEREEVWAEVNAKAQDVFKDGESLKGFLNFMAQCKPQKAANLLLLYSQNPQIRQVKTFESWKREHKTLKAGVHGYTFIADQTYEKDGETHQGYAICKAYDISQIRTRPMEEQAPRPMEELMAALLKDTDTRIRIADNLPENVRAELINGQFYDMAAPSRIHQEILNTINNTIYNYIHSKKGDCRVYPAPFAVKLFNDRKTVVEPDISVICDPNKLTDQGCSGAPDWIIEIISPSTSSHDYVRKLNFYMDAGVKEYWIVDPLEKRILVYYLEKTQFKMTSYTFQDKIKVNIYDDLWISLQELGIPGT